ncbi:uncharacterized protein LOC113766685 [Coffea eugenioides]|uniref:uncharacterized protein LOC113766685 n=1 Tax=Coffea eugenioides TaxID=49369 RepID=UPI000F60A566|nr:uncharacterized protein LOC113766685 [Coffea eugenioides]
MGKKGGKCRLWWPAHLSSTLQPHSPSHSFTLFFGWFISSQSSSFSSSEPSLDIVVAFGLEDSALVSSSVNLQEILHQTDGNMPLSLQDKCTLSVLGYCEADSSGNGQPEMNLTKTVTQTCSTDGGKTFPGSQSVVVGKNGIHACGCHKVHALLEQLRLAFVQNENWFQLISGFPQTTGRKLQLIPELHHLHWNGETISQLDLHVIIYEIPKFSSHHYSLGSRSLSEKMRSSIKKPQWFEDLKQKKQYLDLDTVILAINSAHAAKILSERQLPVTS